MKICIFIMKVIPTQCKFIFYKNVSNYHDKKHSQHMQMNSLFFPFFPLIFTLSLKILNMNKCRWIEKIKYYLLVCTITFTCEILLFFVSGYNSLETARAQGAFMTEAHNRCSGGILRIKHILFNSMVQKVKELKVLIKDLYSIWFEKYLILRFPIIIITLKVHSISC